jgi:hypothetical protein
MEADECGGEDKGSAGEDKGGDGRLSSLEGVEKAKIKEVITGYLR